MNAGADRDDDRHRAAKYALGLMDGAQVRAFEARLADEPDLRAEYARWAENLAALSEDVGEVAPPTGAFARIEERLFAQSPRPKRGVLRWFGLGAVLALGVAMLALWLGEAGGPPRAGAPDLVAELSAEDGALRLTAGYQREDGLLHLTRHAGMAPSGRAFELWLIEGEAAPVSLGVLPEAERALIVIPDDLGTRMRGATLAVSDEPQGGSPTGAPTGAVLAAAALVTSP